MSTSTETAPHEPAGPVMVDVGQDTGALILEADAAREGLEVEIHPVGDPAARTHVWVLPRVVGRGVVHAGVFARLSAGEYVVLEPDGTESVRVRVPPGTVTSARWDPPAA